MFVVLGIIARMVGFSIFKFLAYIKDELLIVLGTSSSESALPSLMEKLERLGCSKSVVGLVVPTGYSFNLDGTNIYMTLATLFIAQALGFDLTLGQQITILLVAMLTSKGASGITGAGFITLAATLAVVDPRLVPGMAIVLGIDKFMSECRALTNLCGNGVACVVVSWWEGELDHDRLHANLEQADRSVGHGNRRHHGLDRQYCRRRNGRAITSPGHRAAICQSAVDEIFQRHPDPAALRHRLRHEDHEHVLLRVDPEGGAARTGPVHFADRAFGETDAGFGADRETEAEPETGSGQIIGARA